MSANTIPVIIESFDDNMVYAYDNKRQAVYQFNTLESAMQYAADSHVNMLMYRRERIYYNVHHVGSGIDFSVVSFTAGIETFLRLVMCKVEKVDYIVLLDPEYQPILNLAMGILFGPGWDEFGTYAYDINSGIIFEFGCMSHAMECNAKGNFIIFDHSTTGRNLYYRELDIAVPDWNLCKFKEIFLA